MNNTSMVSVVFHRHTTGSVLRLKLENNGVSDRDAIIRRLDRWVNKHFQGWQVAEVDGIPVA